MQYDASSQDHGMQFDPFKALVAPRPIAWISTLSKAGVANLAPFSFFNALSDNPPFLVASLANGNDTISNLLETKECTVCVVHLELMNKMNMSSAAVDSSVSEFTLAGLATDASSKVKPARVNGCPAAFECRLWQSIPLPLNPATGRGYTSVILEVASIYIDDQYLKDGRVDTAAMQPVSRLGYMDYAIINESNMLTLNRPAVAEDGKTATLDTTPWDGSYK